MNIQFHFKHVSEAAKADIKEYGKKRLENLEKVLNSFEEDNKLLRLDVEYRERHKEFEFKSTLTIGGKQLHHVEVTHNHMEAIDKTEANLLHQAKKHIEQLREHPHVEGKAPKSAEDEAIEKMQKFNS